MVLEGAVLACAGALLHLQTANSTSLNLVVLLLRGSRVYSLGLRVEGREVEGLKTRCGCADHLVDLRYDLKAHLSRNQGQPQAPHPQP